MERNAALAWLVAGLASLLLVGSLTGRGAGLLFMHGMFWAYAFMLAIGAAVVALMVRRPGPG